MESSPFPTGPDGQPRPDPQATPAPAPIVIAEHGAWDKGADEGRTGHLRPVIDFIASVGFVPLSESQALAVLVAEDGSVENRVLALPPGMMPSTLVEAGNYLTARLGGLTLGEARQRLDKEMAAGRSALDTAARALVERGLAVWSEDGARRPVLIVRGQGRLLDDADAAHIERVRGLLDDLEGKQEIAALLDSARAGDATRIFIGAENNLFTLSGSSVIAKPFRGIDGRVVGVVGVIGPTRLNYARVVPMVDFTAATLARLMG